MTRLTPRAKGFTIVELAIVVAIIAILVTITIVAYSEIKRRAQVSALATGLSQVDKSFRMWALKEALVTWPTDKVFDTGGGIPLSEFIQNTPTIQPYLSEVPKVNGIHTEEWFYDNDNDSRANCTNTYNGTNIVIRYVKDARVGQLLDEQMDDGNLTCGRVRYADERIFYSLSFSTKVE